MKMKSTYEYEELEASEERLLAYLAILEAKS